MFHPICQADLSRLITIPMAQVCTPPRTQVSTEDQCFHGNTFKTFTWIINTYIINLEKHIENKTT
jgi:hypothetical protein